MKVIFVFAAIILAFLLFTQAGRSIGVMGLVMATQGTHSPATAPPVTAEQRQACVDAARAETAALHRANPHDYVFPRELLCSH